jgi:hypothetical protein
MRQIEVINQETIIDVTAETSNVEILVRDYDSELVERFALEAQEAAIEAEESADIATAQASIATAQATIATTQAGIATTQAGIATTQSQIATTKANEASASAASALASEQAADADRIAAQAAASTATTQAGIATTQAGIATTKAGEASDSAAAALASETDAETAASTATTQAGIATTQAGIATTQAGIATTQASNALTSANEAAASAASAAQVGTSTPLTGFSTGANSTILATDTILQGFNKTQGQINARVSGTIATGQVAFGTAANTVGGDNGLFWDNTNKRLGVGTTTPANILDIQPASGSPRLRIARVGGADLAIDSSILTTGALIRTINNSPLSLGVNSSTTIFINTSFNVGIETTSPTARLDVNGTGRIRNGVSLADTSGNVQIGTFTDAGFRLDVNGTARVQGAIRTDAGNNVTALNLVGSVSAITATPSSQTSTISLNSQSVSGGVQTAVSGTYAGLGLLTNSAGHATNIGTTSTSGAGINFWGSLNGSAHSFKFFHNTNEIARLSYTGNLLLNTTTDAGFRLDVNGTARVQGVLTATADAVVNGVSVGRGGGSIIDNTRVGANALNLNTTGSQNAAFGVNALFLNTTAVNNTGVGTSALQNNTTGGGNTAIGRSAGRFIADGATNLTIASNSIFIGVDTRANADNQTNQIVIGHTAIGLGSNTTVIGNSSTTFGRWFGNLLVGSSTNSGQVLQVTGTSLLNGLSTIQGTTASDSGQLGSELLTTGTGDASWTGTSFATGYTHVAGSTTTLTSTLAGVVNTFYQITYTVTGRTAGSFTIGFGGFTSAALTATGAVGPRATTTDSVVITPTSDFNGTIVLSIRTISASSASVTFNSSAGTATNQIRISSINSNTFVGLNTGQRNTTGDNNSFFGLSSGQNNTTGVSNSFFGVNAGANNTTGNFNSFFGRGSGLSNTTGINNSFFGLNSGTSNTTGGANAFFGTSAGAGNTTGVTNSFFGQVSGFANTTGSSNSFFGTSSGQGNTTGASNSFFGVSAGLSNTTASSNSFFGENAGFANTTGANNIAFGRNSGRYAGSGTTAMTSVNNSIYLGFQTRGLNATGSTNEIVIGYDVVGLGSNTTVLGNTSTTFGRWYGSLLLGTTTNAASSILTMESTTQGVLFPRMTTTQKNAIASPATGLVVYDNTLNKLSVFTGATWETVTSL